MTAYSQTNKCQKCTSMGLNGFISKKANSAGLYTNWAGLAVLFSRQILDSSQDFFLCNTLIFIYSLKYEVIERHASAFLTLNILAIAGVTSF